MAHKLLIIGGGKMGEALAAGLVSANWAEPSELAVLEKIDARRKELAAAHPGMTVTAEPVKAQGVVIAVKPDDVKRRCGLVGTAGAQRVLSIAAGVLLHDLERWTGGAVPVVRAMPNTPP